MRRSASFPALTPALAPDRTASVPLSQQLYDRIRRAIVAGQLRAGERVPSSRSLASQLGVSRNTVSLAYMQLLAEGLLESTIGRGTWVAGQVQDSPPAVPCPSHAGLRPTSSAGEEHYGPALASLSRRTGLLAELPPFRAAADVAFDEHDRPWAFQAGVPALDAFPQRIWAQVVARRARCAPRGLLVYQDDAGYRPLREAIASHLVVTRGVRCTPDQVIIVAGAQAALDLAARVLLDPGDAVWIEEPGSVGARGALLGAGAQLVAVPVDGEGLDIAVGAGMQQQQQHAPPPRLVYVTPFHQVPTGATMSLARRRAMVQWAKHTEAWILEDGHGSEYRLDGRPLPAVQGLDDEGRVLYVGTFGKALFPALLVGYLVVPAALLDAFVRASRVACPQVPALIQAALADFMVEGHFTRHLGRMRRLYHTRRAALVAALQHTFGERLELQIPQCGLQLVAWLPHGVDDQKVVQEAAAARVEVAAVSRFCLELPMRPGLVLGYAAVNEQAIEEGVQRLASALEPLLPPR